MFRDHIFIVFLDIEAKSQFYPSPCEGYTQIQQMKFGQSSSEGGKHVWHSGWVLWAIPCVAVASASAVDALCGCTSLFLVCQRGSPDQEGCTTNREVLVRHILFTFTISGSVRGHGSASVLLKSPIYWRCLVSWQIRSLSHNNPDFRGSIPLLSGVADKLQKSSGTCSVNTMSWDYVGGFAILNLSGN